MQHLITAELEQGLEHIRRSPSGRGTVELIVRRPTVDEREVLEACQLHTDEGLMGDNWRSRGSSSTADGSAHPEKQLTLMNSRCALLVAGDPDRRALAGDQLYVDFDISVDNLPTGSRLALGSAVIEVTEPLHTGCAKFSRRFGVDALRFVNSPVGRALRLRGVNARVVETGTVRSGDVISRA